MESMYEMCKAAREIFGYDKPQYHACTTKEDAIFILDFLRREYKKQNATKYVEALSMAIEALKKEGK